MPMGNGVMTSFDVTAHYPLDACSLSIRLIDAGQKAEAEVRAEFRENSLRDRPAGFSKIPL